MTLRRQFTLVLAGLIATSAIVLYGNRVLGKCALFHRLERDHLQEILQLSDKLHKAALGDESIHRNDLSGHIDAAQKLARRADTELFWLEQQAFRLAGFGEVFELPARDIIDLDRMRAKLNGATSDRVDKAMTEAVGLEVTQILKNSDAFAELVPRVVSFSKGLVAMLCLASLGGLGLVLVRLRNATLAPIGQALAIAGRIAEGDLRQVIRHDRQDEFGELFRVLDQMNASLARIVGQVRSGTTTIEVATREVASGNADLASRTEAQASAIEQTSSSIAHLAATVSENADAAQHTDQLVGQTAALTLEGRTLVEQVVGTMAAITAASRKVGDIIAVIDGIAFQTNILALNAAVESARAGESGRGFAVVAGEVRSLAQRAGGAASEIRVLIEQSTGQVEAGSALVSRTGETMVRIGAAIDDVRATMTQVAQASRQQTDGIAQVDAAMSQMNAMTQQNAAMVEQASAAAQSLRQQADTLAQLVSVFQLDTRQPVAA